MRLKCQISVTQKMKEEVYFSNIIIFCFVAGQKKINKNYWLCTTKYCSATIIAVTDLTVIIIIIIIIMNLNLLSHNLTKNA